MESRHLWLVHIFCWMLFMALPLTIVSREPGTALYINLYTSFFFWAFCLCYVVIFYTNTRFLIPALFFRKAYASYAAVFLITLAVVVYTQPFENLVFQKVNTDARRVDMPRTEVMPPPPVESFERGRPRFPPPHHGHEGHKPAVDFVSIILFLVVWAVGMALKISEQWRRTERRVILTEAAKAQAELSFFKAQINPHFLFNTLNNIYSLALVSSENTAPSIMRLSKMMRYITDESTADFVPLADEISCLENFIDLQKLRLNARTKVDFRTDVMDNEIRIAPLILMTFVENAFKYGVSNRHESVIQIGIETEGPMIRFSCSNTIFELRQETDRQGIGIVNTKKRLAFLYPEKHRLEITDDGKFFNVHLELNTGV